MRIQKTKDKKYPIKATLENGRKITVPKQSKFSNAFLRKHGCSLMAEYVALQYCGVHKWPIDLYKWHKRHTKGDVKSKVTVHGVARGIDALGKGKADATYYRDVSASRMKEALEKGQAVIMEQKNPIHSICIIPDGGEYWLFNYGNVTKANVDKLAKTATTNKTYRGMVTAKAR